MNLTNRIENIAIASVSAFVAICLTVLILEMTSVAALKKEIKRQDVRLDRQSAMIMDLARLEKYRIENTFSSIKAKEGQVILLLDNQMDALRLDSMQHLQVKEQEKKFWQNLKFWRIGQKVCYFG